VAGATRSDFRCALSEEEATLPPFGLCNPSKANRCYANSLAQCLLHLRCLPLAKLSERKLAPEAVLWRSLVDLHATVAGEETGGEKNLSKELLALVGTPGEQQDAHELLMALVRDLDREAALHKRGKAKKKKKPAGEARGFTEVAKSGRAVVVSTLGVPDEEMGPVTELFSVLLSSAKGRKKTLEPSLYDIAYSANVFRKLTNFNSPGAFRWRWPTIGPQLRRAGNSSCCPPCCACTSCATRTPQAK
jgi:hypothetical protein